MTGTTIVKCSKCKKQLFYLNDKYKMACPIVCIECGSKNPVRKKRRRPTATANFAKIKAGVRKDVHSTYYFRSPTEANFARILEYIGAKWKFEEKTFDFTRFGYQRKPFIYIMDFEVTSSKRLPDGLKSGWIEVKGRMDSTSRNKLRRLKKCYPEEAARTTVVVWSKYKKKDIEFCKRLGYNYLLYDSLREKYEPKIPTWE